MDSSAQGNRIKQMSLGILEVTGRCDQQMCGNSEFHRENASMETEQCSGVKTEV